MPNAAHGTGLNLAELAEIIRVIRGCAEQLSADDLVNLEQCWDRPPDLIAESLTSSLLPIRDVTAADIVGTKKKLFDVVGLLNAAAGHMLGTDEASQQEFQAELGEIRRLLAPDPAR